MKATIRLIGCFCADRSALRRAVSALGLGLVLLLSGLPRAAAQSDDDFFAAREAFRTGNRARLDALAPGLQNHVLAPYVAYWRMRQRFDEASAWEVRQSMEQLADGPLGDRLRNDWLKLLGKRGLWDAFEEDRAGLRSEDMEVSCHAVHRGLQSGDLQASESARSLWLARSASPEGCNALFEAALAAGVIAQADVWARIRLALQNGQVSAARSIARYLPRGKSLDAKALSAASTNPRRFLARKSGLSGTPGEREVAIFALQRLARSDAQDAAARFRPMASSFPARDREYVWSRLAYHAATRHDPDASSWYAQAGHLSDDQLAWRARAALRAQRWDEVLSAVESMTEAGRSEPEWRYWSARAYKLQGKIKEANALLAPLSTEHHFYALLAGEELGNAAGPPVETFRPSEADIRAIAAVPAIRRALALYQLGLRFEGNREWLWAIGQFDDRKLITAAEYARRNELWDRAINTAERTRGVHDFNLRYLAPYRNQFQAYAVEHGLDEAWVLGLVRQESRFVADARSSAGAMGLMQLMPATARWVAGKLGMKGYRQAGATDLVTNISFGTYYLRYVLDTLDNQPVLASAGYNAGPGRARAWRSGEAMEGAVYAETIPFAETRDYVKKVMANSVYYARILGLGPVSLKDRMGVIPAREVR